MARNRFPTTEKYGMERKEKSEEKRREAINYNIEQRKAREERPFYKESLLDMPVLPETCTITTTLTDNTTSYYSIS